MRNIIKIALAIESSNSRGMGHLFRSLLYVDYLKSRHIDFVYLINQDPEAIRILKEHNISFFCVDYADTISNWETTFIHKHNINVWVNDKFETSLEMATHIHQNSNVLFCMIDDIGDGEELCDLYFAGMIVPSKKTYKAKQYYAGSEYIILNSEIRRYAHERRELNRIIVSLGGSDPHKVTYKLMDYFSQTAYRERVDYIIGPSYHGKDELEQLNNGYAEILQNVPSLVETFSQYDLAVTGGGVTCCEACAAGLPVVVIANAPHEINTGIFIESLGCGIFAGDYNHIEYDVFREADSYDLNGMSRKGLVAFDFNATDRIFDIIMQSVIKRGV